MHRVNKPIWFCLFLITAYAHAQNTFPSTGNVGVGTTTPAAALQVVGNVMVGTSSPNCDTPTGLQYYGGISNVLLDCNQNIYLLSGFTLNTNGQPIPATPNPAGLYTQNDGFHFMADNGKTPGVAYTPTERLTILSASGNVGIGMTSPAYPLDVTGKIHSAAGVVYPDGTTQTTAWTGVLCGGDYAESVDVTGTRTAYEPGDVMVVDASTQGNFHKSSEPYSTLVAGIYSTKPGAIGRRSIDSTKAKDEIPMAMIGIVPTKVSAENGPVKPGDLLVTSSTLGYAMRGTDRNRMTGAIVGKALGSVQKDTGIIEVLVTLQ